MQSYGVYTQAWSIHKRRGTHKGWIHKRGVYTSGVAGKYNAPEKKPRKQRIGKQELRKQEQGVV